MKRLTVLVLVLGSSSLASGELIFTVNGEPQPGEITLMTSETIELGLDIAQGHNVFSYALDYELTNAQAEFIWDNVEFPTEFDFPGYAAGSPQSVGITAAQFLSPPISGRAVLMQGLIVHCLDAKPVDLTISTPGGTMIDGEILPAGVLHTLHIVQVPEPMTAALIDLGGLALIRRRRW